MKKKQPVTPLSDEDCRALEGRPLFDSRSQPVERDAQGRPPPVDQYGAPLARHSITGLPLNFYRLPPPGKGTVVEPLGGRGMASYIPPPPTSRKKRKAK